MSKNSISKLENKGGKQNFRKRNKIKSFEEQKIKKDARCYD